MAWRRFDGSADLEFSGEVLDGVCEFHTATGIYNAFYLVKRQDGSCFGADQLNLVDFTPRK